MTKTTPGPGIGRSNARISELRQTSQVYISIRCPTRLALPIFARSPLPTSRHQSNSGLTWLVECG
jgi:hypothetical protein